MRTNQIETKITRIIDGEVKVFTVYSDANNFSEAFTAHCKAILDKVAETDKISSFGCVEVYEKGQFKVVEPNWELISVGNDSKIYYDKERGMYKVEFSNGRSCVFDEY